MILSNDLAERIDINDPENLRFHLNSYGVLGVNLALLNQSINKKLRIPLTEGYPPTFFISYRWENEEHKEYVKYVAKTIENQGFKVHFDQNILEDEIKIENFNKVPEFVSSIADCHYFLMIITEKYIDNIIARKGKTSWVYDEQQNALYLQNNHRISLIGLVVEDDNDIDLLGSKYLINVSNNKYDLSKLVSFLDKFQKRISKKENEDLLYFMKTFEELYLSQNEECEKLLNDFSHLKIVPEYNLRRSLFLFYINKDKDLAYEICNENYSGITNIEGFISICPILEYRNDFSKIFKNLYNLRKRYNKYNSPVFHYYKGYTLIELNSYEAGKNHLEYYKNNYPQIYERKYIKEEVDKMLEIANQHLMHQQSIYKIQCSGCNSKYSIQNLNYKICGDCGTCYHDSDSLNICPICSNDGTIPYMLSDKFNIMCPVCFKSSLKIKK